MAGRTGTVAFITAMAGAVPLADEATVKAHLEAHKTYQNLTKRKKELLADYKKAKEEERIARMTKASKATNGAFQRMNSDLNLDIGLGSKRDSSSAASKRAGDMTMEERKQIKQQLREWK